MYIHEGFCSIDKSFVFLLLQYLVSRLKSSDRKPVRSLLNKKIKMSFFLLKKLFMLWVCAQTWGAERLAETFSYERHTKNIYKAKEDTLLLMYM